MIHINLLGEEKDRAASYAINAISLAAILFVFLFLSGWVYTERSLRLSELEAERESKKAQNESLRKRTAEVEDLEIKQALLKEKLGVIANLKAKKQGPVKILDQVSTSIPDKAWITEISQNDDQLTVKGVALDGQTVSDFMTKLRETPNIKETDSVSTELVVEDDLKLQKFTFPAKLVFLVDKNKKENQSTDSRGSSQSQEEKK